MPDDSILDTIMSLLGPEGDYEHFAKDICVQINAALNRLATTFGVGSQELFLVSNSETTWRDFLTDKNGQPILPMIIQYVFLSTKLIFDPSASSVVASAQQEELKKIEYELYARSEISLINEEG